MVKASSRGHRYRISFPGGELFYLPLERIIYDQVRERTISLPEKREFSLLSAGRSKKEFRFSDYKPVCLTIYSSHRCNLNCSYCYIPEKENYCQEFIAPAVVEAGADATVKNCKERILPFIVGFHGGNEPLLHLSETQNYLNICKSVAERNGIDLFAFCTTNGVIPESTARWAAGNFYGITLSWDGPPEIHDAFRKDRSGKPTSERVERSAGVFTALKEKYGVFRVRCTVTSRSVERMQEIAGYFRNSGVKIVEFYPVFQNRDHTLAAEVIPDPVKFVYYFLKARSYGMENGMDISFSGTRLNEYHNRFCMMLQDNLTLTPDGYLTNCYYHTNKCDRKSDQFSYGKYHKGTKRLEFENDKLNKILNKYAEDPVLCTECFNQFHCSHGCPDVCPFNDQYNINARPDCLRERWLGLAAILDSAGYLNKFDSESEFSDFFQNVTSECI